MIFLLRSSFRFFTIHQRAVYFEIMNRVNGQKDAVMTIEDDLKIRNTKVARHHSTLYHDFSFLNYVGFVRIFHIRRTFTYWTVEYELIIIGFSIQKCLCDKNDKKLIYHLTGMILIFTAKYAPYNMLCKDLILHFWPPNYLLKISWTHS